MTKTILAVFVVAAVAALMIGSAVAPAYAAKKTFENEGKDEGSFLAFVCGQLVDANFKIHFKSTIWDNSHFKFHSNVSYVFTDPSTGEKIGVASGASNNQGKGDLPQSFQSNFNIICQNGEPNQKFHFGQTIHRDGTVTTHGSP